MLRAGRAFYTDVRFVGYIAARALSFIGDNIWWIAIAWSAAKLGDPRLAGLVLAAPGVARAVFMLVGGVVADLRGARRVMLLFDLLAGFFALVAAVLTLSGSPPSAGLLLAVGLVFGTVEAFYLPAANSYLAALLPRERLARGTAVRQFVRSASEAVGLGLGGVLVAAGGFALAAVTNSATFLLCFAILVMVRPRYPIGQRQTSAGMGKALADGVRYVVGSTLIRSLAILTLVLNMVVVPVETIGLSLRSEQMDWGPSGLGLVRGCLAAGLIVGGLIGTVLPTPARPARALALWLVAALPGLAAFALGRDLILASVGVGAYALCFGVSNTILSGLLMTRTRSDVLGRVQSVVTVTSSAMTPVGTAGFGWLVDASSLDAVGVGCVVCVAVVVVWMLVSPALQRAEREDSESQTDPEPRAEPSVQDSAPPQASAGSHAIRTNTAIQDTRPC
jgi:MFS family permease